MDAVERKRKGVRRPRETEADEPLAARELPALGRAVTDREEVIGAIKSSNALVRNSLACFTCLVGQGAAAPAERGTGYADLAAAGVDEIGRAIVSHGRTILERMPVFDGNLDTLIRSPVEPTAASLRALLVARQDRMNREATVYHALLFVAAVLLLRYLSFFYLKLRRSAAALGQRTATPELRSLYQSLVADLSTSFIDGRRSGSARRSRTGWRGSAGSCRWTGPVWSWRRAMPLGPPTPCGWWKSPR